VKCRLAGPVLAAALALAAAPAAAQLGDPAGRVELERLQLADTHERAGDLARAEEVLREIMEANPASLSGLLSLERVLRLSGRLEEVLEPIERLLRLDPGSAIGHQARLRTFSSLDRVPDLERAAAAWIRSNPRNELPYREVARVWRGRGDLRRAAQALEQGRSQIGRPDALALDLGDIYSEMGDRARAIREWERAIGGEGRGLMLVRRRIAALPDGGASVIPGLVDALAKAPSTLARRRAAVELAIDAGLAGRAEAAARAVASELRGPERQSFLIETARQADGARLHALALWAYSELRGAAGPAERTLAIRKRIAELSLAVGDTAAARAAFAELEGEYAQGSIGHREAAAVRIQLGARDGDPETAARELAEFRRLYADAPDLDATAAAVATAYLARGDAPGAERLLAGVRGPRSALARGRAALQRGDVPGARAAFMAAAPHLGGNEQTEVLALATLLGRLSEQSGRLLADALGLSAAGEAGDAVALLTRESELSPGDERAALLDFAAGLADRHGLKSEGEKLRRTLVTDYATSLQAPAALLGLARSLAAREPRSEEAALLLEKLILDHPRSALVPQARRELDRIRGRVPSS
jgi:hypothetical protein